MTSKNTASGDDRFSKVKKDPRFWEMPNRERKVKIDERFQSMFHDQRFKLKYTVDKRGRPVNHTTTEDLKRFYKLSDSEEEDENTEKEKKAEEEAQVEDEDESDESEEEEEAEKVLKSEKAKKKKEPMMKGVRVFEEGTADLLCNCFVLHILCFGSSHFDKYVCIFLRGVRLCYLWIETIFIGFLR